MSRTDTHSHPGHHLDLSDVACALCTVLRTKMEQYCLHRMTIETTKPHTAYTCCFQIVVEKTQMINVAGGIHSTLNVKEFDKEFQSSYSYIFGEFKGFTNHRRV